MEDRKYPVKAYLYDQPELNDQIQYWSNDTDSCSVEIAFYSTSKDIFNLENKTVSIVVEKADGIKSTAYATVTGENIALWQLTTGELTVGTNKATIQVYSGTERLTFGTFKYKVLVDPEGGQVTGNNNYPILVQLINDVQSSLNSVSQTNENISQQELTRETNEENRVSAEVIRISNENTRVLNETDRINRFNSMTTEQQQDMEVVDARQGKATLRDNIQEVKTQLADKQNKTDNTLGTIDKTIVGSINEVNTELAKKATNERINNRKNYLPSSNIGYKAIYKTGTDLYVVAQKPNGKDYVSFKLNNSIVASDAYSVGGSGELTRVVSVLNVDYFKLLQKTYSNRSTTGWGANTSIAYGSSTVSLCSISTPTAGEWVEYTITVPHGVYTTTLLVYASNGSSDNVDISVDGVVKLNTSFKQTTAGWKEIEVPITPGGHTVRITIKTVAYASIAGLNLVDLKNFKSGYSFDTFILQNDGANPYITNQGAIDYAMVDADTGLYCGSYHGGETRNRLQYLLDNTEISLTDGSLFVGKVFEIEQDTSIVSKLNAYSRYMFRADGIQEFEVYLTGNMNITRLFSNMTTTHTSFNKCIYPKVINTATGGDFYLPIDTDYIVQKNPITNRKITTILNDYILPLNAKIQPRISSSSYYNKVYKESILSDALPVAFTSGNFKSVHIFE